MSDKEISKIFVILASPKKNNSTTKICLSLSKKIKNLGVEVDLVDIQREEEFKGFFEPKVSDTKSLEYQIRIKKSDLVMVFYTNHWSILPGILTVFIEKVFRKGFAFAKYKNNYQGLLDKKSFMVVEITEQEIWKERFLYKNRLKIWWKRVFFKQCNLNGNYQRFKAPPKAKDENLNTLNKQETRIKNRLFKTLKPFL